LQLFSCCATGGVAYPFICFCPAAAPRYVRFCQGLVFWFLCGTGFMPGLNESFAHCLQDVHNGDADSPLAIIAAPAVMLWPDVCTPNRLV